MTRQSNPLRAPRRVPSKETALKELRTIPGVGKSIAVDLYDLGLRRVSDLRKQDPEKLYGKLTKLRGSHIDRCVLYVFRCAVYYASAAKPRAEKLLWWNWKDQAP